MTHRGDTPPSEYLAAKAEAARTKEPLVCPHCTEWENQGYVMGRRGASRREIREREFQFGLYGDNTGKRAFDIGWSHGDSDREQGY
jgi:hypothetical protein